MAVHGRGRDVQWFPLKLVLQILKLTVFSLTQSTPGCDRRGSLVLVTSIPNTAQWHFLPMLLFEVSEIQAATVLES